MCASIADQNADTFILYHYNGFSGLAKSSSTPSGVVGGMSGGVGAGMVQRKLTRLTLFRRSQESVVGQSVAFSSGGSTFAGSAMAPIEEVSRRGAYSLLREEHASSYIACGTEHLACYACVQKAEKT